MCDATTKGGVKFCRTVEFKMWQAVQIGRERKMTERARFEASFGRSRGVLLARPDGYVGFVGGKRASAEDHCAPSTRWPVRMWRSIPFSLAVSRM